jgi:methylenetetrahydrofolate reductase (NADPH)
MHQIHKLFFNFDSIPAASLKKISEKLDQNRAGERALTLLEKGIKGILLDCLLCGDCGIQYLGFICPESQCPKHIRNGACGGSRNGKCEVDSEKYCVWYRAYERLALIGRTEDMATGCVPPRMWELNKTSSWTNFHLRKDHQSKSNDISKYCTMRNCFWKD